MKRILSIVLALALLLAALPLALGVSAAETAVATFELGANSSNATHVDGNAYSGTKSYTDGDYTLSLTSFNKVYGPAYDAKGNSCIKLGTSSATGSFSFTVPADVTRVEILAAKYKSNTTKITVNGKASTLTKNSNDGAYDVISVDTSATKTVSFATVSGGVRAMVNTIIFYAEVSGGCEHTNTTLEEGDLVNHYYVCDDCGNVATMEEHDYELIEEIDSSCTEWGSNVYECATCGKDKEDPVVKKLHNYENGACTMCEITNPVFDFGANGALTHKDGDEVSKYTETVNDFTLELTGLSKAYTKSYDAFGNSCLKLGTSSVIATFSFTVPNNVDEVIIAAAKYKSNTSKLDINGTQKELTKNSDNGEYELISIDTTETKTITVKTVTGACRAMINSITFVVNNEDEEECTHENTAEGEVITEATYFTEGEIEIVCDDCGEVLDTDVIPCDTAAPVIYTYAYNVANGSFTINWTYSPAFEADMAKATKLMFNFELDGYSKDIEITDAQVGGSVTLTGFNAARLNETLYFGLNVVIDGVANTSKFDTAAAKEVNVIAQADNDELDALLEKLEAATAEDVIAGEAANTADLVESTIKLDVKAGTANIRFVASDELVAKLAALGRDGREVTLCIVIDGVEYTTKVADLRKATALKVSGLSFENMYSDISVKLAFDYEGTDNDFATVLTTFECDAIVDAAEGTVAEAFENLMK